MIGDVGERERERERGIEGGEREGGGEEQLVYTRGHVHRVTCFCERISSVSKQKKCHKY